MAAAAIGLVLTSYAFYVTFPEWWYVRLLLPAWPVAAAFAGVGALRLVGLAAPRWRAAAMVLVAMVLVGGGAA